jgi:hypothetical protein
MERKTMNFGMIGHKFMGKSHSHDLRDVNMFFDTGVDVCMKTLCGIGDDLEETPRLRLGSPAKPTGIRW